MLVLGEACPNGVGWYDIGAQNLCLFVANATDWSVTKTWNDARRSCETLVQGRAVQLLAISTPDVQVGVHISLDWCLLVDCTGICYELVSVEGL